MEYQLCVCNNTAGTVSPPLKGWNSGGYYRPWSDLEKEKKIEGAWSLALWWTIPAYDELPRDSPIWDQNKLMSCLSQCYFRISYASQPSLILIHLISPNSNISHHIVGTHQMSVSFTVFLWRFYSSFDVTSILSSLLGPILYHVFISKVLEKRNDVLFFCFAFHKVPFIESNWVGLSQMKLSEKKIF